MPRTDSHRISHRTQERSDTSTAAVIGRGYIDAPLLRAHAAVDWELIGRQPDLVVDTRNAMARLGGEVRAAVMPA